MTKAIYFDMDGTIADLYGVENWLDYLVAEQTKPYREAKPLCSEAYFNDMVESCKYNRGEVFEKLVTEHFGQVWTKDNLPFTEGGDLTVDGVAYQLKYQKATFCNEKSIASLAK